MSASELVWLHRVPSVLYPALLHPHKSNSSPCVSPACSQSLVFVQIKLGPSLFIPNSQIGSFGAVTQFKSLVKNHTDMFDVSFAGPLSAATVSLLLFVVGLALSSGGNVSQVSPATYCSHVRRKPFGLQNYWKCLLHSRLIKISMDILENFFPSAWFVSLRSACHRAMLVLCNSGH